MAFQLLTFDDIKKFSKGGQDWSVEFEDLIEKRIIPAVTTRFAEYCRRPDWDKTVRTEYLSPSNQGKRLFLGSPPVYPAAAEVIGPPHIDAIEALKLFQDSADPPTFGPSTELTSGFVVFEDQGIIEHRSTGFIGGPKSIKVTYTGGYLTADGIGAPDDVRLAAIMQTKIIFDRREEFGVTGRSLEGGSVTLNLPMDLPDSVKGPLKNYKLEKGWF